MTQYHPGSRCNKPVTHKSTHPIFSLTLIAVLLGGCSGKWGWYVIDPTLDNGMVNLKFLLSGLWHTISLSMTAISLSSAGRVVLENRH